MLSVEWMSVDLYNILLAMYADAVCIDKADEVFEDMKSSGDLPAQQLDFFILNTVFLQSKAKLGFGCCSRCSLLLMSSSNVMAQTPKEELSKLTNCIEKDNTKLGSMVRYLVEEKEGDGNFSKGTLELVNSNDAEISNAVVFASKGTLSCLRHWNKGRTFSPLLGINTAAKSWLDSRDSTKSIADLNSLVLGVPTMAIQYR
ncbi:hypothetical protein VNO77_25358 [Canavalia gladiata]|uniref:Pentatricopeptide repeat-containing protein n=1 Tax=Canavalia gladiata TaxID=3824 RepID=A0AAN9QDG7_CANGL